MPTDNPYRGKCLLIITKYRICNRHLIDNIIYSTNILLSFSQIVSIKNKVNYMNNI